MCRSGSDFAVCPRRFCRARCLAEGFGESKNWKSSMRPDMFMRYPQVCRCRVSKDLPGHNFYSWWRVDQLSHGASN